MLLTLSAKSLVSMLRSSVSTLSLTDIPAFTAGDLGLRGLCIQTDLLSGINASTLDALRDAGDKAGCPCLILIETTPHPLGDANEGTVEASINRMRRVIAAAQRLGCSGISLAIKDTRSTDEQRLIDTLKRIVGAAERLELNVLVAPEAGRTENPEDLTTLIRKVGGFRIGSFPDFEDAAVSGDATTYLRAITPYASAIVVPTRTLDKRAKNPTYNLDQCMKAIRSVGYDATLAIECRAGDPVEPVTEVAQAIDEQLGDEES